MTMTWVILFFAAFLGSFVQGVTGFGAVIVMMIFLPSVLPISTAAGIGGLSMFSGIFMLAFKYRHQFKIKRVLPPFIVYAAVATWSVNLGKVLDTHVLKVMLGILLISLSLYFTFVKSAGDKTYPWYVSILFMIISGFFNGLFGIGGPLMALYFLSMSDSVPEYMGNLQGFFLIDAIYITIVRIFSGIITVSLLPLIVIGTVAVILGTFVATRVSAWWNLETIKPVIYVFIGISGIYYLFF